MTVLFPTPPTYCSRNAHALRQSPQSEPIHPYLHSVDAHRDDSRTLGAANGITLCNINYRESIATSHNANGDTENRYVTAPEKDAPCNLPGTNAYKGGAS